MIASYVYQGTTYTVDLERLPDGTYRALIDGESIPFRTSRAERRHDPRARRGTPHDACCARGE